MAVYNPSGAGNVHVDEILTNISIAWPNSAAMAGSALFPSLPVRKQSDKYYIFGREMWLPEAGDLRAPGTVANEVPGLQVSTDTYYAQEHALSVAVTDEERENSDAPLAPDRDGTELVTKRIMLGREIIMKNLATATANYASTNTTTLVGTAQWNDQVNSDPIANLRTGKSAIHARIFEEPNTVVIPYQVMTALEDHPDFLERIKYSERAIFSSELLSAVLGIQKVVVPGVGFNSANEGATPSLGYLWGKDVVMAWVPPRTGLRVPCYGYEFTWGRQFVDRWREEPRVSDLIRVRRRYDVKLTALGDAGTADANKSIAGYLIKSAIA
jgi:hypothetical protein